jgi:hypothetical protein
LVCNTDRTMSSNFPSAAGYMSCLSMGSCLHLFEFSSQVMNWSEFIKEMFINRLYCHESAQALWVLATVTKMPSLPDGLKMVSVHDLQENWCANCRVSWPIIFHSLPHKNCHLSYDELQCFRRHFPLMYILTCWHYTTQ